MLSDIRYNFLKKIQIIIQIIKMQKIKILIKIEFLNNHPFSNNNRMQTQIILN
jgi:ureidoglycolate hydrolase